MKIHKYKELEDGGADLEVELTTEEARTVIEIGLTKVLRDFVEEHEKKFEDQVGAVRKHDEVIRAWLDGKDVQYYCYIEGRWEDYDYRYSEISPMTESGLKWRVKPNDKR